MDINEKFNKKAVFTEKEFPMVTDGQFCMVINSCIGWREKNE